MGRMCRDLDEAAAVQNTTDGGDDARALNESLFDLVVDDEVEVAPPIPRLDIGETMVLLWQRPQRLRQHLPRGYLERQLAATRAHHDALGSQDIAHV